jgi:Toxin co-regulated pilus biosynthesis protein Q
VKYSISKLSNSNLCKFLISAAMIVALSSCANRPAPDFGGRWKNVNRFSEETQAIPLQDAYLFYASPMDGTLKKMLERWAKDSDMVLTYRHPMDYTLYAAVADIRTPSLQEAVSQINAAYASQQVSVGVSGSEIVVRISSGDASGVSAP